MPPPARPPGGLAGRRTGRRMRRPPRWAPNAPAAGPAFGGTLLSRRYRYLNPPRKRRNKPPSIGSGAVGSGAVFRSVATGWS